jgi:hypothetical protein
MPLAHAAPVDPTWIGGLYDNGDGDDAVLAVQSLVAEPGVRTPAPGEPVVYRVRVAALHRDAVVDSDIKLVVPGRAPPLA